MIIWRNPETVLHIVTGSPLEFIERRMCLPLFKLTATACLAGKAHGVVVGHCRALQEESIGNIAEAVSGTPRCHR